MIRLCRVDGKNVWELLRLEVDEAQKDFVASNTEASSRPTRLSQPGARHCRLEFMTVKRRSAFL